MFIAEYTSLGCVHSSPKISWSTILLTIKLHWAKSVEIFVLSFKSWTLMRNLALFLFYKTTAPSIRPYWDITHKVWLLTEDSLKVLNVLTWPQKCLQIVGPFTPDWHNNVSRCGFFLLRVDSYCVVVWQHLQSWKGSQFNPLFECENVGTVVICRQVIEVLI